MKKLFVLLAFLPFAAFSQNKVGINTKTPQATLHVKGDMKVETVNKITSSSQAKDSVLVMEDGIIKATTAANVVAQSGAASATIGDIKTGIQAADHNGWIKLNGRAISTLTATQQTAASGLSLSGNLPNANNAYLSQNGAALGSVSGTNSRTIAQNQLPDVNYTGTLNNIAHGQSATTVSGVFSKPSVSAMNLGPSGGSSYVDNYDFSLKLNGGVTQQALDIKPATLSVNTFIYLGN